MEIRISRALKNMNKSVAEPVMPNIVTTLHGIPEALQSNEASTNSNSTPPTFSAVGVLISAKPLTEVLFSPIIGILIERFVFKVLHHRSPGPIIYV